MLLCTLLLQTIVAQADYAEVNPSPLTIESVDDTPTGQSTTDSAVAPPGVRLMPSEIELAEGGAPSSYQVILRKRPTDPVAVSVSPDNQTAVSPEILIFVPAEWNVPQEVTIWAQDDNVTEGLHGSIVGHHAASTDPDYTGLDSEDLLVTIEDNDTEAIRISPTTVTVAEPQGSAVLTLTLASLPGASVTVPLAASNDECGVTPASVVLGTENWESGAKATVSATDDTLDDGDQICLIEGGPSTSSDPAYDGLVPDNVTVIVLDDDEVWRSYLPVAAQHWPPLPGTPTLQGIDNPDGDGRYTLRWGATTRAETYVLEEANNPGFDPSEERYAGPDTAYGVEEQGATRLYYRVKARNSWGDSFWSKVEQVDVLWEIEPNEEATSLANGPLVPDLVYYGAFPTGQDTKDYFFFDLATRGTVRIWLKNIPPEHNYDLVLRDNDLETRPGWYSGGLGNQDEFIEATVAAGRYHVQVFNASGLGNNQAYHLQVQY